MVSPSDYATSGFFCIGFGSHQPQIVDRMTTHEVATLLVMSLKGMESQTFYLLGSWRLLHNSLWIRFLSYIQLGDYACTPVYAEALIELSLCSLMCADS
jgi:hypothetical protein